MGVCEVYFEYTSRLESSEGIDGGLPGLWSLTGLRCEAGAVD